jgi:sugar lactone lactonase YvrE
MTRSIHALVALLLSIALFAPSASATEVVKLKPLLSVYIDVDGQGMQGPEGIGCGPGAIVVADTRNGRLLLYSVGEDTVRSVASLVVNQVPFPVRAELLADGDVVALDGKLRRIARISPDGQFKGYIEIQGAEYESVAARSLAVDRSDRIFVLDVAGNRVLVIDTSGRVERSMAGPDEVGFLSDLAVDERGDVYAVDSVERRVFVARKGADAFEPLTPSLGEDVDFPTSIAVDNEGRLFVVDDHGGGIVILGRDGSFRGRQLAFGWKNGFVRYPSDVCVGDRNILFLSERGNSRVQMFEIR